MNIGTGLQGEITFMDLLGILSFLVGVQNLNENLTQNDKSELQKDLAQRTEKIINEAHRHLEQQDIKLNELTKKVEEIDKKLNYIIEKLGESK